MTTTTKYSEIKQALIDQANAQHAQYPQYANKWDNWVVAKVLKTIKVRGMEVSNVGEYVLVNPNSFGKDSESRFPNVIWCTAYFPRCYSHGCSVRINSNRLQIV